MSIKQSRYDVRWYRPDEKRGMPYRKELGCFLTDAEAKAAFDTWRKEYDPHHARVMWLEDQGGRAVTERPDVKGGER